jgi:hypothetical protein
MDKVLKAGAVFIKQWHGAGNTVSFGWKGFLRGLPTGGVPRAPSPRDMYYLERRSVANGESRTAFSMLQTTPKRKQPRLLPNDLLHIQVPIRFGKREVDHQTGELLGVSSQHPRPFHQ